jgi:integrase
MQKLLDAAEPEIKNIIVMGLFSGCRLDELASLKKSEIQAVEGVRCFYISKSKTKAGIRYVPIHPKLSAIVDEYLSHNCGEYLFPQANKINRADGKKGPSTPRHSPGYAVVYCLPLQIANASTACVGCSSPVLTVPDAPSNA